MWDVEPGWLGAVLICHNEREPTALRPSCGGNNGAELRGWLRDRLKRAGFHRQVLCTRSGCLDVCSGKGVTVALLHTDGARREVIVVEDQDDCEALWRRVLAAFRLDVESR